MPFTPFHFGPGAALHSAAPRKISFLSFCAANVLIDFESLYYLRRGDYPVHRFFHTFVGATIAIAATVALFLLAKKCLAKTRFPNLFWWKDLVWLPVITGAVLGGYSHILLDGIMHRDIHPLAPFSDANPFLEIIFVGRLHELCLASGLLGIAVIVLCQLYGKAGKEKDRRCRPSNGSN